MKIRELREQMGIKFRGPQGPWEPYFAWRPKKDIHGKWHWLSHIYRRERNRVIYPHQGYDYGTSINKIIDALRD